LARSAAAAGGIWLSARGVVGIARGLDGEARRFRERS
jgi:hypothetical protein